MDRSGIIKIIFTVFCIGLFLYMTLPINPLIPGMYNFHDETQLARVSQFVLNLRYLQIPPRLAPNISYGLGFPLFNFYAPTSYWFTSTAALLGLSTVVSLKLSFFMAISVAFVGMFLFLRRFFDHYSSFLGSTLYISATYFATEIVIRGNLAESWFLALFPLCLYVLIKNSQKESPKTFLITTIMLSLLFTTHNIFSLLAFPLTILFILFFPRKKRNVLSIVLGLLMGSYFIIPSLLESRLMNITSHITEYNYKDHFLCVWQLWRSNGWNFGPSLSGCEADQMSFKIGKIQLGIGLVGIVVFIFNLIKSRKLDNKTKLYLGLCVFTLLSLFMTLYQSEFIWNLFSRIVALFQFPWRFILLGIFGLGFFGAYLFNLLKFPKIKPFIVLIVIAVCLVSGKKYFVKPLFSNPDYNQKYNSADYVQAKMGYMMPEYITPLADYRYWRFLETNQASLSANLKNPSLVSPFEKNIVVNEVNKLISINVHEFPYWRYFINEKQVEPDSYDNLGRPQFAIQDSSNIVAKYEQTDIEKFGNILSIIALLLLFIVAFRKKIKDLFPVALLGLLTPLFFYRLFSSFRMPPQYNYDSDFGRDLLKMAEILHGKITLIGPQLSFAGVHMAPYSYYLFAPLLLLSNYNFRLVQFANSLLFLGFFVGLYLFLRKKMDKPFAFLSVLWLASTPYIVLSARSAGNAFTYLPLFGGIVLFLVYVRKISTKVNFLVGFLGGVCINFHPAATIVLVPAQLAKIILSKDSLGLKIRNSISALLGMAISYAPVLLFEIRHNFVLLSTLSHLVRTSKFVDLGPVAINAQSGELILTTIVGLLLLVVFAFFANQHKDKKLSAVFLVVGIIDVFILLFVVRGVIHYFFPTLLFFQLLFIVFSASGKYKYLFVVSLLFINVLSFPHQLYERTRNLETVETNFEHALTENPLPKTSLNVILINDTYLSKVGYEYRYVLAKNGYAVDDEYSYANSHYLIMISEKGDIDWQAEKSWELEQFGDKKLVNKFQIGHYVYYLLEKKVM